MADDGWVSPAFAHLVQPREAEEGPPVDGENPSSLDVVRARVIEVVESIPPGRAMTYGDIGALVGAGARQVGRVMATNESDVPWWRVTNASGALPDDLVERATKLYLREGTPMRGVRVDLRAARWRP